MEKLSLNVGNIQPTVNLTINKNRVKVYHKNDKDYVYFNDKQEFEIELYNPTSDVYMAHIKLNGQELSGAKGVVVQPGQRVYVERYFDKPKKFQFKTYMVEDNKQNDDAIQYNGMVEVIWYKERKQTQTYIYKSPIWVSTTPYYYETKQLTTTPNQYHSNQITTCTYNSTTTTATNIITCSSQNNNFAEKETGRISSGSNSSQTFTNVDNEFEYFGSIFYSVQILPTSQKKLSKKDFNERRYCIECGSKIKSNYKYCPICGQKQ